MLMIADPEIPSSFEEDEVRSFLEAHIEFVSPEDYRLDSPDRINVDVLWPKLGTYLGLWRESKRTDPWAAGQSMSDDLKAARVVPPEWPRKTKKPPKPKRLTFDKEHDEIPF